MKPPMVMLCSYNQMGISFVLNLIFGIRGNPMCSKFLFVAITRIFHSLLPSSFSSSMLSLDRLSSCSAKLRSWVRASTSKYFLKRLPHVQHYDDYCRGLQKVLRTSSTPLGRPQHGQDTNGNDNDNNSYHLLARMKC